MAPILIAPALAIRVVPSGFEHPICEEVAVVQLIAPRELVIVLPSVLTPPNALVVAGERLAAGNIGGMIERDRSARRNPGQRQYGAGNKKRGISP